MYVLGDLEYYQGIGLLLEGFHHALVRVPSAHLATRGGLPDDIAPLSAPGGAAWDRSRVHFLGSRPTPANWSLSSGGLMFLDIGPGSRDSEHTPMKIYSYLDSGTAVLAPPGCARTPRCLTIRRHISSLRSPKLWETAWSTRRVTRCSGSSSRAEPSNTRSRQSLLKLPTGSWVVLQTDGIEGQRGWGVKKLRDSPTLARSQRTRRRIGFSAANLIMARVLPTSEYGLFTLAYCLVPNPATRSLRRSRWHRAAPPPRRSVPASPPNHGCIRGVGRPLRLFAGLAYNITLRMLAILLISTIAGAPWPVCSFKASAGSGSCLH